MLKKLIFVYVFIFSYAGAVLHSIVPHHHHDTYQEANEHNHHNNKSSHSHHHDKQSSNSHHDDKKDTHEDEKDRHEQGQSSALYFLTHGANSDVLTSNVVEQKIIKSNNGGKLTALYSLLPVVSIVPSQKVFHPPSAELIPDSTHYLFRALRAPPLSIV